MKKAKLSVGLVHYPVVDKSGKIVCTNVTNLDVHDIARACRVYDVDRYYIINQMKEQLMFVSRLLDFWRTGVGANYNHMRRTALTMVRTASTIEETVADIGGDLEIITTSARNMEHDRQTTFKELRESLRDNEKSYLLLFGTGFGMADQVFPGTTLLEPIKGVGTQDYRHLSVRSAVSICLDRLLGPW